METSGLDCIGGAHRPHELAEREELAYGACPLHHEERGTSAKLQSNLGIEAQRGALLLRAVVTLRRRWASATRG